MFVQVIDGRTSDPAGVRRQLERWAEELRADAVGFLGSTAGVAGEGTFVAAARFESAEAARRNADRPEQGEWWADTEKLFDGPVTFRDCPGVDLLLDGGSDEAGFVQVVRGRARDKDRLLQVEHDIMEWFPALRPEFIGSLLAWDGDHLTEVAYFTSEAEARAGEARVAESEHGSEFQQWLDLLEGESFVDLTDPWLFS